MDLTAIADSPVEWMVATRLAANDLLQAFGLVETAQIAADGSLRVRYLGPERKTIADWAARIGIPVSAATVDD